MRRLFSLLLGATIMLVACTSSELSITEIQSLPTKAQKVVYSYYPLQLINDSKKGDIYIIYHSTEIVTAQLEVKNNILDIKLDSISQENNTLRPYLYKITRGDAKYDTVRVLVNGQDTPLDVVSGF